MIVISLTDFLLWMWWLTILVLTWIKNSLVFPSMCELLKQEKMWDSLTGIPSAPNTQPSSPWDDSTARKHSFTGCSLSAINQLIKLYSFIHFWVRKCFIGLDPLRASSSTVASKKNLERTRLAFWLSRLAEKRQLENSISCCGMWRWWHLIPRNSLLQLTISSPISHPSVCRAQHSVHMSAGVCRVVIK